MTAAMLVLEPIFEARTDRPNSMATVLGKMPNRRWSKWRSGCSWLPEVVDADSRINSRNITHAELLSWERAWDC